MPAGLTDILTAIQNAVNAINNLNGTLKTVFPNTTASSTGVGVGTITFNSSQASGFALIQTSSGATVAVATYPLT